MPVLVLDCQATGASPQKGHVVEIGWQVASAVWQGTLSPAPVESCLLRLPANASLPKTVARVTGITPEALTNAESPRRTWRRLAVCARGMAAAIGRDRCPTVIHFARYERSFLRGWHERFEANCPFPFEIACTHELARRLLPGLPRKGLRAVAGYLGYSPESRRRSADHVQATAHIWHHLVQRLQDGQGIESWEALQGWLSGPCPPPAVRSYPMDPALRRQLPDEPGIYRMRRSNHDLLYVGKAVSLHRRVNGYFRPRARHPEHTLEMLSQARRLDVTTTPSALEAAVLECDEIKEYEPPYNLALKKADRRLVFCSPELTQSRTAGDNGRLIGPFPSLRTVQSLIALSRWLADSGPDAAAIARAILQLSENLLPPAAVLAEGLRRFSSRHASALAGRTPLRAVTSLGAKLWRDRRAEATSGLAEEDGPEDAHAPAETDNEWTPPYVQRAIESTICHAARMLRRARWFRMLSESDLSWEPREAGRSRHRAQIRQGRLVRLPDGPPPALAEPILPIAQRGRRFDLATYDRLRVITTEIRRLIAEGRDARVRLIPRGDLDAPQLRQLLRWL